MADIRKCAIIGCGNVGATTAFALMQSELFSEILLVDIDKKKAQGEASDLEHSLPFLSPISIRSAEYSELFDCALIIITAGANQKPGQTRTDLVIQNTRIFESIVGEIVKYNKEAILLVVTNPVDILTYVSLKISGYPPNRVIGSGTVLDTARLKQLVGNHLGVDSRNVHTFIIGEHGDSELAVFSSANISGIDLDSYCSSSSQNDCDECSSEALHQIYKNVKNSAYEIIEAKGATYYAIAMAVKRIATAIVRDENTILPVSTLLSGQYGLNDICLGLPCVVGKDGIKHILEIPLDENELERLTQSAEKLSSIIDEIYMPIA